MRFSSRLTRYTFGRQPHDGDVAGHVQVLRGVPARLIDQQRTLLARLYAPETNSLTEVAGLSGFAGVKLHQ